MNAYRETGLITVFSRHPVAANLLMVMMLLAGVWGIKQLNTQFFPTFDIDYVNVRTTWSGASSEDVESLVTIPMEQSLRDVDFIKSMTSTSAEGVSSITIEFAPETDMGQAVDQVKQNVDQVINLPADIDQPVVQKITRYEGIARLLVAGPDDVSQLRNLVNRFETELLDRGIAKVFISGLPEEEISIEIPTGRLRELDLSLEDIGNRIRSWSQNLPVGIIGQDETSRQLRFRERRDTELSFASVPVVAENQGRLVQLADIADIERKPKHGQVSIRYQGRPAVEMSLNRTESSDSLEAAGIFYEWLEDTQPKLPQGIELVPYSEQWQFLQGRISLLVKNGLGGLTLVVGILFLFMHGRVAWWIAVGIPVSFMAALAVLYFVGGSINMISLFALIMALGIIVDDAIVVGENAMAEFETGIDQDGASERAARRMLGPVFSSSLSTIAAFLPLMLVGGIMGSIMQSIPLVVICVIIASLIECFLILPGHLTHSFRKLKYYNISGWRRSFDRRFDRFRDGTFRKLVSKSLGYRWTVVALSMALLVVTIGYFASGRIGFQFFPTAEADRVFGNVGFVSGTPADVVESYLERMERALYEVERESGEDILDLVITRHGSTEGDSSARGDQFGAVRAELVDPDQRQLRNRDIISAWQSKLPRVPGVEFLTFVEPRAGPPGSDIDIRISGGTIEQLKSAALELQDVLRDLPGLSGIGDDAPFGREQMILELTPTAKVLGVTVRDAARQLRAAYDGFEVQTLSDGYDEVDVTVQLPEAERRSLSSLNTLDLVLPNGRLENIENLATVRMYRGFETIRHDGGQLAVSVIADVDPAVNNANKIRAELERGMLPRLSAESGLEFRFEGRQGDQAETLGDMKFGLILALALIYLILTWVFGSYGWPFLVMIIIPFGIVGAVWGHVVMGQDVTLLSLFGFFGLAGIVVNDSIILVMFYKQLREGGMAVRQAIEEAVCQRLRAVILTSLTTVAGLTPLLFETSLQAQFLIPMAISLAFGLSFATLLILFLLPSLLLIYESAHRWIDNSGLRSHTSAPISVD
ncbi:MAG: efflux RND transporter permease subunit [Pseudomonadota bacterium]